MSFQVPMVNVGIFFKKNITGSCSNFASMKNWGLIVFLLLILILYSEGIAEAQCSICTKTAQQLGEKPARGLNAGIIYLAVTPFLIAGYVFYRWRKSNNGDAT